MRDPAAAYVVHWEENPETTRLVTGRCKRCERITGPWDGQGVISPNGIEHMADSDVTFCGAAATGPEWWWPV